MNPYYLKVEIKDEELQKVMEDLETALKLIEACSSKLRFMSVGEITKEEAASGN